MHFFSYLNLSFTSGADTNIQGGKLSGEKVTGSVGGDLNIESKQDSSQYKEQNSSAGLSVGYDFASNQISVGGGANKTNIDSEYSSVTEQSGIYAGEEGFDIRVEKNTDLKGGVIASEAEAEKNKISTGTLTWEDIKNKAEYEIEGKGLGVNVGDEDAPFNERGVTPGLPVTVGDESSSTTKAAIADGTIEIRDKENQKQDISGLNRDTQNSLNKLGEIFNKKSIEERQELIGLFGEIAYNQIHDMKDLTAVQKTLLHGLVGGIMSKLAGEDMLTGISAAAINKMLIEEIRKAAQDDPAAMQWISAALGTIVDKAVGGSGKVGGAIASSATKNNDTLDAEIVAQGGGTKNDVIEADQMQNFEDVENQILEKFGVESIYQLSLDKQSQVIQQMADTLKISFEEALYQQHSKDIFEGTISLGVGIGGFVHLPGGTGKAVIDGHVEGSTSDDVKMVGEVALYLQAHVVIKIGGEYRYNYYPKTKVVRVETFVGIDTPYGVIGINDMPNSYDCIIETGAGGYLFSGGEIKGKVNMSEFYKEYLK